MRIDNVQNVVIGSTDSMQKSVPEVSGSTPIESELKQNEIRKKEKEATEVVNSEILDKSIEQANKSLEVYNRMIERTVHEKTNTIMYALKDTTTNEVIREFPPKKIQDMIAKMWELAGLFVDEKA